MRNCRHTHFPEPFKSLWNPENTDLRNWQSLLLSFVSCHQPINLCTVPSHQIHLITGTRKSQLRNWLSCFSHVFYLLWSYNQFAKKFPATAKYLSRSWVLIYGDFGKSVCHVMVIVNDTTIIMNHEYFQTLFEVQCSNRCGILPLSSAPLLSLSPPPPPQ